VPYLHHDLREDETQSQCQTSRGHPNEHATYVSLSWNYKGSQIPTGAYLPVTLTLAASSAVAGIEAFSFTMVGHGDWVT
jgi:hypothetical protein